MKQRLISGHEYDWVTSWRHVYQWNPGAGNQVKRGMNKRFRKEGKHDIELELSAALEPECHQA